MKKTLALLLSALMLITLLAACGSKTSAAVGSYKLESIDAEGTQMTVQEYVDMMSDLLGTKVEFDMSLTINKDGTFKMTSNIMGESESTEGTWKEDGDKISMTVDGETETAAYKDGKITMESEGTTVTFAK